MVIRGSSVEMSLYYLKSRYYDPVTGRFISQDDVSYIDTESINGLNLYAYCGNNPVMRTDSQGANWWTDFWNSTVGKIVGTILVVAAVVALSIATAGVGGAVTAALGSGFWAAVAGGAVGGAISGAIFGAGISMVSQGISSGYANIDYGTVGIATLTGAVSGALLGGIAGAFKYVRAVSYLKKNGETESVKIKEIMQSFKGTPSLKTAKDISAIRYYDGVNAMQKGRYLTTLITKNPIKDLVLYNNQATMSANLLIQNGTKYLAGTIAGSPVNAIQFFVANINWLSLIS